MPTSLPADYMANLAAATDPSDFSVLVAGTPYHTGQLSYARNANGQVNFLLPGNSWGKTEFIWREAIRKAWRKEGPAQPTTFEDWLAQEYNVLIASYNYNIAKESFIRFKRAIQNRPTVAALVSAISNEDPVSITLTNGAKIQWGSLKGDGMLVEGVRYRNIYVDEVGHIPDLASTYDNVLYPRTMGVAGVIHLFGTPKSYSDPYLFEVYEKGQHGGDGFHYSQSGSVFENQFWPSDERERVLANPRYVTGWVPCPHGGCEELSCVSGSHPLLTPVGRQVILGAFVLAGGLFFNRLHVARIFEPFDIGVEWTGENFFTQKPQSGHLYMGGFDLAGNKLKRRKKSGSDPTVGMVVDYTTRPWKLVYFNYIPGGDADWQDKYNVMHAVYRDFRLPYLLIDATGQVDSVQEELERRGIEVDGIHFGGAGNKKLSMLRNLQLVMELEWEGRRGVLRSPLIPRLKHELDHYVLPDDDIVQDCVMTLAMVCNRIAEEELPPPMSGEVY